LLGEQDFAASNHDSFDANSLVMVTLRQATSYHNCFHLIVIRIGPIPPLISPVHMPV
jgi:hypothetical protein